MKSIAASTRWDARSWTGTASCWPLSSPAAAAPTSATGAPGPGGAPPRRPGLPPHRCRYPRRRLLHGIPVGDPISVLVDLATCLPDDEVEDAVNEADRRDLVRT